MRNGFVRAVAVVAVFSACIEAARAEVIISEIMYNPVGTDWDTTAGYNREFIEIFNAGNEPVDLSGWQIGDSQDNVYASPFAAGTMIQPGQALAITGDAGSLVPQWAPVPHLVVGNFPDLANNPSPTNETVALRDHVGVIRDSVNYDDANGWTVIDGSQGASIFLKPSGLSSTGNDLGANWAPSMWGVLGGQLRSRYGLNHGSPGYVATEPQATFAPSSDAVWSMVVVPDTQNYVKASAHQPKLLDMIEWIRDHRQEFNIHVVLQEGDIVNQNSQVTPTSGDQTANQQWQNARNAFSILNGELPYIMATGNHDYGTTNAQNRSTQFNSYFTPTDNPLVDPAHGGILKGMMVPGSLENAYYEFTAPDGRKMLIFSLEWGPRQVSVDWANTIAALPEYEDHTAVLLTHAYMNHTEERYNWAEDGDSGNPHAYGTANDTNDGEELWNELVKLHGNFEMTLNGHVGGDGVAYLASTGLEGNTVHQMLINTQFETNGGNGFIRLFEFLEDGRSMRVRTYSVLHDLYRTDPANEFTITLSPLPITGDYNGDGTVDAADYTLWQDSLGSTEDLAADGDGNGTIDSGDYDVWKNHFTVAQAAVHSAVVPEPTSAACLLRFACLLTRRICTFRRSRRSSY